MTNKRLNLIYISVEAYFVLKVTIAVKSCREAIGPTLQILYNCPKLLHIPLRSLTTTPDSEDYMKVPRDEAEQLLRKAISWSNNLE